MVVFSHRLRADVEAPLFSHDQLPFDAVADVIVLEGLHFHTDAWVVRRAASLFSFDVWLA